MQEMMYSKYTIAHNSHNTEVKIQVHGIKYNSQQLDMNKELMANQFNMK